jgi:hypothetical protein
MDCHSNAIQKKVAYSRMEDVGIKCQLFFVSQPLTVYEVNFLILDMIWMASKQAITLFGLSFRILQKMGCSTQILTNFSDVDFLL